LHSRQECTLNGTRATREWYNNDFPYYNAFSLLAATSQHHGFHQYPTSDVKNMRVFSRLWIGDATYTLKF